MPSTTRRSLPPGVYWRRRLAALSAALVLVLGIGKVLGHFSDGSDGSGPTAAQAGATTSSTPAAPKSSQTTGKGHGKHHGKGKNHQPSSPSTLTTTATSTPTTPPPLPDPSGPCDDDDVYITPTVTTAVAGSPVTITLNLQTQKTAACTWQVSPDTVAMKITSGPDLIWSSQQCPKAIPTQDVVIRNVVATQVAVVWSAKRYNESCTPTAWVLPGYYHAWAASLGGDYTDVQFELTSPVAVQVTETATPTQTPSSTPSGTATTGAGHGKKHHHHNR